MTLLWLFCLRYWQILIIIEQQQGKKDNSVRIHLHKCHRPKSNNGKDSDLTQMVLHERTDSLPCHDTYRNIQTEQYDTTIYENGEYIVVRTNSKRWHMRVEPLWRRQSPSPSGRLLNHIQRTVPHICSVGEGHILFQYILNKINSKFVVLQTTSVENYKYLEE